MASWPAAWRLPGRSSPRIRAVGRAAAGDRGGAYADPGRVVRGASPRAQAELVQAADLLAGLHDLGGAAHDDAPPGPGPRVVRVGLEPDEVLAADAGQLRSGSGADRK